ncbi:MAG: hypothetical protein ACLQAT_19325 [Candidatus Binataceae bacterium]
MIRPSFTITASLRIVIAALVMVLGAILLPHPARAQSPAANASLLSPPPDDGGPTQVAAALYVTNLAEVDEARERFHIDGYLFERWKDPRLAFKPPAGNSGFRDIKPGQLWIPSLVIVNAAEKRDTVDVNIKLQPDGTVDYSEAFSATLSTTFALQRFPFDHQSLEMVLQPYIDERSAISLVQDESLMGVSPEPWVPLAQWRINGMSATTERAQFGKTKSQIPEVAFSLEITRRFNFYIWKVFLPLIVMVIISWSVFWIKISDHYSQITIALTTILTVIAFSFSISSSLPRVPYLTYIDAFFLSSYLFVFFSIVELIIIHQAIETGKTSRAVRIRSVTRWLVPSGYLFLNVVLILIFF